MSTANSSGKPRRSFLRRKPKDPNAAPGRLKQIVNIFKGARQVDPAIGWWMIGAAVLTLAVVVGIGFYFNAPVYAAFLGLPIALLAATLVLSRRAERAAYRRIEGQPGAAGAAMGSLKRGWYIEEQPVAADVAKPGDVKSAAIVYRALGRAGVVLVAEGPVSRCQRLLQSERKRIERVAPGVPVTLMRVGADGGANDVAIRDLTKAMRKLKPVLTKAEVSVVNKRLKSLGGVRAPIPGGIDPTRARVDRRATRGR